MTSLLSAHAMPFVCAALASGLLVVHLWRRRQAAGARALCALMGAVTLWTAAAALETAATTLATKLMWANVQYYGIVLVPPMWLLFTLAYTRRRIALERWLLWGLAIEPAIVLTLLWTDARHGLFRTRVWIDQVGSGTVLRADMGPAFWTHAAYAYLLLMVGTWFVVRALRRAPQRYRGQAVALLAGIAAPWIANVLYLSGNNPLRGADPTPLGFCATGLAIALGSYRFRLMDLVPVARETVIENLATAVLVLDTRNRVIDANPRARELFADRERLIGDTISDLLAADPEVARRSLQQGSVHDELHLTVGGRSRYLDLRIAPLCDLRGRLTGRVVTLHEITALKEVAVELRRARDAAEAASRAKSEFLATMSHEIRTPLNGVLGLSDLLLDSALDEEQRELTRVIHVSGRTLLSLIDDILDFSKIEAGQLGLESSELDVRDIVSSTVAMLSAQTRAKGIGLSWSAGEEVPERLLGDPTRLRQVLVNLVGNAVKFTEAGEVCVRLDAERAAEPMLVEVRCQVIDSGIGIPPDKIEAVFESFSQADSSTTRRYGGSGLGLAITRRLVDLMGGRLEVHSEVGVGSTFEFTLPLRVAERAAAAAEPEPSQAPLPPDSRVLIVEDNPVNQMTLRKLLEKLGIEAEIAGDGELALTALQERDFDVVFMDVQMPVLDGMETTRRIVASHGDRRPWIIATTANATTDDHRACLEAGMEDFVTKPLSLASVTAALGRVPADRRRAA